MASLKIHYDSYIYPFSMSFYLFIQYHIVYEIGSTVLRVSDLYRMSKFYLKPANSMLSV